MILLHPGLKKTPLLALSPLLVKEHTNAKNHFEFSVFILNLFGKKVDSLAFMIGDNENQNRKLATSWLVPFIGCVSHRLNLAVKQAVQLLLEPQEREQRPSSRKDAQ